MELISSRCDTFQPLFGHPQVITYVVHSIQRVDKLLFAFPLPAKRKTVQYNSKFSVKFETEISDEVVKTEVHINKIISDVVKWVVSSSVVCWSFFGWFFCCCLLISLGKN
jgi:hypothetical protein